MTQAKPPTFSFDELCRAVQGEAVGRSAPFSPARVWTDTRSLQPGDFFLPICGLKFDGHEYLSQALSDGAAGAFVQRDRLQQHPEWLELPNLIAVDDTTQAYLDVARYHRQKINPLVIAVTGSSGKTTTKEMLYAAFSAVKKTVCTQKSFNNEFGVSQTLLSIQPDTEVLIVEMGMRGPRQIAPLSLAAQPDAALVVNAGSAHIEFLGSVEAIAHAKLEIAEGLNLDTGFLVVNGDNEPLSSLADKDWQGQLIRYSLSQAADRNIITGTDGIASTRFTFTNKSGKSIAFTLPIVGDHLVANALGVLSVGDALGFDLADLAKGLATFTPPEGRGESRLIKGFDGVRVINDAYNANPDSLKASLKAFLESPRNPEEQLIIVLGGMKELGDFTESYHKALGEWLAELSGISRLITVGAEARWMADSAKVSAAFPVEQADTIDTVATLLLHQSQSLNNSVIYLKGSRAYGLEALADKLEETALADKLEEAALADKPGQAASLSKTAPELQKANDETRKGLPA